MVFGAHCRLWSYLFILSSISYTISAPQDVPSAASFYVPNLPGLHQDSEHPLHVYAGHILSDPNAAAAANTDVLAHLFFVMVKARRASDKERLMFWFNGGPGCSSFDGLMMEVGPWKVDGEGGLITTDGGWEEYTTMVYIDQPAGTGLSYTSTDHYIHTLSEASEHILEFLRTFYEIFPEYQSVDTYLGGESYAGQYIPYFANAILASSIQVPLRGIAIGNGWIDARNQYPAYLDYAVKHGLVEDNSEQYRKGKQTTDECMAEFNSITGPEPIHVGICEGLALSIPSNNQKIVDGKLRCTNVYDVRLQDTFPACGMNWPPELKNVTSYLARKDVINALHASAKSTSWVECFGRVSQELRDQLSPSAITLLPKVLEKIPVLLFAGDQDFICNYMGIESMIKTMNWNGQTGLGVVNTQSWSVEGSPAGTWVSSRNLTYVKIFNASHMAPYDVPNVAHDMILRFMGMNFSAIVDGSAHIPSTVGDDVKPVFNADLPVPTTPTGKTPEQNQAMWEAYYNAGSIALIVVIIACAVALCLWCRLRRRHIQLPKRNLNAEENIPLNSTSEAYDFEDRESQRKRKGKQRADESEPSSPIFDVGDDEDDSHSEDERRQ